MSRINCRICNEACHSIDMHLQKAHGENSNHPITLDQYKTTYPDAPLLSEAAKERIEERRKEKESATMPAARQVENLGAREPMAKLFGLGNIKDALTKTGKDIMVSVSQVSGYEELIPEPTNYIFEVDILKSVLMALEMNIPAYLYGHAGTGKSTFFEQVCARTKRRMVRVQHTPNTEESHIVGQWTVKKHKDEATGKIVAETIFDLGPLPLAMINGWTYLADEYDRGYPSVLSVYQAVLEGKPLFIKEADAAHRIIKPHPEFRIVATGNTNGAGDDTGLYQATVIQDAATFERFGVVAKKEYMTKKQEMAIVRVNVPGIVEEDADRIVDFCQRVREQHPQTISLTIGPRVAVNIAKIGLLRGDFKKGIELAFANRLPESEREAALSTAQRIFG